jgi:hypothetical protein
MDWECTPDYCKKFAAAFKEMLRENSATKPNYFETPAGTFCTGGKGEIKHAIAISATIC